jgi:hypothetical protein
MAGLLDNLATGLGAVYGFNKGISDVQDVGSRALQRAETAATDVAGQTQFKPFTVTSGIGGVSTTPTGGLTTTLTPEQQALQQQLQGFGTQAFGMLGSPEQRAQEQATVVGMLTGAGVSPQQREAEIMQRLQAAVSPEQERQRMALEERLLGQGRLGVATNQYGGTPEQLALEKAIAEQQAGLGVSAMEQARAEQQQQASQTLAGLQETRQRLGLFGNLGLQSLGASYLPQQQLLNTLSPAIDIANLAGAGQRQGAQLGSSLIQAGLTSQLGAETAASNLRQQQIQAITNLLGGQRANTETGVTEQTGLLQSIVDRFTGGGATTPTLSPSAQANSSPAGDVASWQDFFNYVNTGGGSS